MANKTLNNVKINMTLKSTTTRAKLSTSSEDLAVQMGKINKWYDSLVPTGGESGNILGWNSDGTAKWVTVAPSANKLNISSAVGGTTQPVYFKADGTPEAISFTIGKSVPANAVFTDQNVKSTLLAQSTAEASYRPTFVTGATTGGVYIIDSYKVNHTPGTTSAVGNTRLVLGNATASGTANNEEGQLKLYSSGTSFHTLKGTTISSETIHVLPSTGGTILNTGTTSYTQTSSSSATGAYEIGKIKINGTTTTIYGKDTGTTYTASDGIKIESGVIKHTNAITAVTTAGFYKFKFDAQGHITGTASVAASDIPPLNYVPNTQAGVNAAINLLSTGSSTPTDADYYISQYVGGGTTTTTYHRRPMSALWAYIKGKADPIYAPIGHTHTLSIVADSGTNQITLSASTKYKLTAGGSSFIFTTPPNTTYSAGTGISLSGTTFSNSGVRSTTINGNYLRVNTNGTNADLTIPYATTASKLGSSTVGSSSRPIYLNAGTATQCDTPASGAYWAGVPYVGSNGAMEIGKYIDFHASNTTTLDYDYRITAESQVLHFSPKSSGDATYNLLQLESPEYNQIRFSTSKTGKAYTSTGIVAYPLTTSGQTMLIQSDGNTVVGGGESPRTLYSNSYDNMDTAENETLYLASDSSEIHFITNCQAYSGRKVLKVQDGQLVKTGGQWIAARDVAPVYTNKPNTQDGAYYPAWFGKTKSGGWSMGVLSHSDNLYITYTTDEDYSEGNNNNTYLIQFQNKTGIVALTSDVPTVNNASLTLKGAGTTVTTFTANASTNQSLDIVAGSNVTITPDATNHKITIASSDMKVTQTAVGSTYTNYRPLVISASNADSAPPTAATVTDGTFITSSIYCQPSSGSVYATKFIGALQGNADTAAKWKTARTLTIGSTGKSVDGSGNVSWSLSEIGAAPAVTGGYLPLSGGTMSGTITHPANTVAINLRDDGTSTWQNTIMTQSTGDEAVVFANANVRTSWMFVNGEDSIAHPESDRWQSLTPALQIKGGCVAIGKLIPHGTTPTTKLDVAGDASISGTLYIDSKVAARHTATPVDGKIMIADGTTGGIKSSSYTIATSVPSGAVFTDTHVKVTSNTSTKAYLIATTTSPAGTAIEGVGDANVYLAGTNHVLYTPGFSTTGANKGYRAYDQASTQYAIIYDNGSNLWVGAEASNVYHHKGQTYISAGWTGTLPTTASQEFIGNSTIFISVPKYTTNAQSEGSWNHTPYAVLHSGNTSFTRSLTSGTKIGTIKINGTSTDIYCETNTNTDTKVYQSSTTTSDFRPVLFGKNNQTNPENLETAVTDQAFVTKHIFAQPSTGNLCLYSTSGDSPALVFRRGTLIDNLNDWKIYVSSGALYFDQSTANASSETWTHKMYLHSSDGKLYVGSSAVSVEGHTHLYAGSSSAGGAATSANKLNTNAGTVSNPVYFTNGVPTACDYPKSGAWAPADGGVPFVTSSGVLEIGPYIDFHSKTSTADYDLRLSEESANLLALKNSSPTFRIHSTGHTNAALELWREGDNYTDYRIINMGGNFRIQSDYIEGTGHTDWFDMLFLAYTTGNATFKGSGTFGGIITTYRESSTTDNLPAGIVFSNKDTTTGLTNSGAHIYAYNDHANPSYGENLVINAGGCLFIGSGEAPDSHYAAIKSGLSTNEDTYMTADRYVYIQGCGSAIAARKGMMVYTTDSNNGNHHEILPTVADTATNNVGSIGSSSYKWNAMYASSYYGEFDCLNEVANNTQYAMVLAMNPNTHQPNTLRKTPNAIITFKNGTASEEGWAQITLGNETKAGTAGNSTGWIKLYSPSSGSHYITGASTTSAITHTLPTVGGTVLNSGNYLQYMRSIQKLYAATTTKGWRRILTIPASNSSGYTIGRYEFHFTRQWNNGPPESFGVRVICNYTTPIIHLLYAEQNSRLLTDFRVARSSDSTKIHFEVWYDATTKNDFSVRYVIQDPYLVPHDFCTFPTETDGSSAGSSFLPVVSDSPTSQATIPIPTGGISQFNLRQVSGSYSGYFGMADAAGSDSAWIRTTSQGLLPYQSSNATDGGICSIGTSGWYFKDAYIGKVVSNTADFECFQPRHSNEFSMKQISYNYIWFNYRLITDDKQGYTTEPTNPINQYWFGCGKARNALAKVVTSGMTIYPGAANATSYSTTLQSASLTANRTATLPNATGTIPLITEKYNSPTSTATSYNLTYAASFKLLMITTKPSSSLFGETTVIVPAPTAAGTTKTYVNWPGVNAEAASQPTRTLGGNIRIRYTNNDTCTIDCVLADYYLQAGASVSSGSTSGFSVYITRVIGISY